jgi:hypothetical protein
MAVRTVQCDPLDDHLVYSGGYDFSTCSWDLRHARLPLALTNPLRWQRQSHTEFVTHLDCSLFRRELVDCSWDATLHVHSTDA